MALNKSHKTDGSSYIKGVAQLKILLRNTKWRAVLDHFQFSLKNLGSSVIVPYYTRPILTKIGSSRILCKLRSLTLFCFKRLYHIYKDSKEPNGKRSTSTRIEHNSNYQSVPYRSCKVRVPPAHKKYPNQSFSYICIREGKMLFNSCTQKDTVRTCMDYGQYPFYAILLPNTG